MKLEQIFYVKITLHPIQLLQMFSILLWLPYLQCHQSSLQPFGLQEGGSGLLKTVKLTGLFVGRLSFQLASYFLHQLQIHLLITRTESHT